MFTENYMLTDDWETSYPIIRPGLMDAKELDPNFYVVDPKFQSIGYVFTEHFNGRD